MKCVAIRQITIVTAGAMSDEESENHGEKNTPNNHSATPLEPGVGLINK